MAELTELAELRELFEFFELSELSEFSEWTELSELSEFSELSELSDYNLYRPGDAPFYSLYLSEPCTCLTRLHSPTATLVRTVCLHMHFLHLLRVILALAMKCLVAFVTAVDFIKID